MRGLNCKGTSRAITKGKPVIYWMSRDQRVQDNWAMLYAQQCAKEADAPLAVCFSLVEEYLGAGLRQFGFMLRGLKEVEAECSPEFLLQYDIEALDEQYAPTVEAAVAYGIDEV